MKIRVTLMTENGKHFGEQHSKEYIEAQAKIAWQMVLNMICRDSNTFNGTSESVLVESCELVER